jgi:deoxyribonuclease V
MRDDGRPPRLEAGATQHEEGLLKAALDVHYDEARQRAWVAAVVFCSWADAAPAFTRAREHRGLEPYASGQFFRRELPCLLPLVDALRREAALQVIVIDGHVDLRAGRPGLGRHLFDELGGEVEIVGVAKSPFAGSLSVPVYRGASRRPLWISATGSTTSAVRHVLEMHGDDRLPILLRLADHLARGLWEPQRDHAVY